MKITYLSHSGFLIETASHRLMIDPWFTGNSLAQMKAGEARCDFLLISHGHDDHFGDAVEIATRNDATLISTFEVAGYAAHQGVQAHPMHIGGSHEFPFGRVKFTIAHHSSSSSENGGFIPLGNPAGILIFLENKTLYHAGDTGLFLDMKLIAEMHPIDVAMLPIGDNFTMGIDDAVKAVEFLQPQLALPMHYNTFDLIKVDPQEFVRKVEKTGRRAKAPKIGETIEF